MADSGTEQLEATGETDIQLVESFNRAQQSMQGMESHSTAQTSAVRDLGAASAHHSQQLQEMLSRQNRKLIWCFAVLAALLVVPGWGGGRDPGHPATLPYGFGVGS